MNTLLDIPKGAEVIDVCKAVEEMMNESEERGELRMLIYFVHMYFVALCALILYKGDYHNFKTFFITASGSLMISWLTSLYKERKNR
ncbi:hypothetical protein DWZ46_09090 [Faecalibacterium prausnitzii]|uniref:Uncharacterized protein n=1 Tax=Faecalibacterium prausnitzii TaxID=853 RepID=A0A3E2U3Z7_9FIRM|nr:hypothetical protein [Faecalibacterium prausnitzii]RGB90926.1 hypothetical protein DWZ46_09090 [Faecalibacterium prausnitzii]